MCRMFELWLVWCDAILGFFLRMVIWSLGWWVSSSRVVVRFMILLLIMVMFIWLLLFMFVF